MQSYTSEFKQMQATVSKCKQTIVIPSGVPPTLFFKTWGFGLSGFGKSINNDIQIDQKWDQFGPGRGRRVAENQHKYKKKKEKRKRKEPK